MSGHVVLAVALEGAGWHPQAWREQSARPDELFSARYWSDLAKSAEEATLDFLTIEDSLALQSSRTLSQDDRTDWVRGRLDAVLVAARIAPLTSRIGLVPTVTATHTEPFHISKAIATLDFVSHGRAGVRVKVSANPREAAHFGRRTFPEGSRENLMEEANDYVEVLRRLWDSWEDDAVTRDVATGRFVDREKLHYIDFAGPWFSVKGPSITPRPPQGQPVVMALAHAEPAYRFALRSADVTFVTPFDVPDVVRIMNELDQLGRSESKEGTGSVLADLVVFLGPSATEARDRKSRLDEMLGHEYRSDAAVFVGSSLELADLIEEWVKAGTDGFRLRPAGLPYDLELITKDLVPELRRRALFKTGYEAENLRAVFGLSRPPNRFEMASVVR
jgi:alkanesulfonate monooxygenase SsuD/methylene tetrahydromethanopterin reductase-like flavin-dependent oxidoreductase (luciferase family)